MMPEISFCLFDLNQLFKLFPKEDKDLAKKLQNYELKVKDDMAENRYRLFKDFGYQSEFEESLV